ncbi:MAG: polyphosphate kinase 1, partial [Bdellovibrionota bacterium]
KIFEEKILPQLKMKSNFTFQSVSDLQNTQMLVYLNKDLFFEVPRNLPPLYSEINEATGTIDVFFLDALLESHLDRMLPIKEKPGILRVTRDADFTIEIPDADTESIPDLVRKSIGSRDKGRFVRIQHSGTFPKDFLQELADHLKVDLRQVFKAPGTLCLHGLLSFVNNLPDAIAHRPGHSNPPLVSKIPTLFKNPAKIFDTLDQADFMLHHPYDSFEAFLSWLRFACEDPHVVMIEQTIYRTDSVSEIVDLLKLAAPKKKIKVILELRARFDESNNLRIAEELAKAGAEVKFGFGALKLHAKVTLVTRKLGEKLVRYTHLSTGNYSARTARQYTDISILTANAEIGEDARYFFDNVFRKEVPTNFKHLVTAPTKLHQKIRALIKSETEAAKAGKKGRIVAKVNALVDEKIIEDLYQASQAGVSVDLIVRGACSLIPGVKGLSENIRVISIVDRFLEHSRIYYFGQSQTMYLSSADWMPRNFFSRLEIAFPVLDARLFKFITDIVIPGYLKDNVRARRLTSRGVWEKVPKRDQQHRAQWYFEDLALSDYKNTPLKDHRFLDPSSKS